MKNIIAFFSIKKISALIIIATWFAYYLEFGHWFNFSKDTAVWGQFGDFLGGVINPLLTFITVIYLINSVNLQREANNSLISLEEFKKTEAKIHNMLEGQRTSFESFRIETFNNIGQSIILKDGIAVSHLEEMILDMIDRGYTKEQVTEELSNLDKGDNIFSLTRRFYNIIKTIQNEIPAKDQAKYFETLLNMTEYKQICLILIALEMFDWTINKTIDDSGIFSSLSLEQYRKEFHI